MHSASSVKTGNVPSFQAACNAFWASIPPNGLIQVNIQRQLLDSFHAAVVAFPD